jgi:hypothetical protein
MESSKINFKFNLALFAYLCVNYLASAAFDPSVNSEALWDKAYGAFPVLSVIFAIVMGLLLFLWGAKMIEVFWNRFIAEVFKIREIVFQEALALILISANALV